MAETQTNSGLPPEVFRRLRQVEREFKDGILPQIKARRHFVSRGEKRRGKVRRPSCQKPNIRFSPFAMTLGYGLDVQSPIRKSYPVRTTIMPAQTGQLISVFVIAMIKTDPPVYVMQKVLKKSAPGFPGGGIEEKETVLEAAAREWKEESNGGNPATGANITLYNPLCIGKFVLDRAMSGEQGAVVFVELPKSEIVNIKAGGGAEEGEVIEKIYFLTFEEVSERAEARTILPNSARIWDFYLNWLVNTP